MILIIEDNADIRQELAAFLGANGHPAVCLEHYPDSQEEMADAVRGPVSYTHLIRSCPAALAYKTSPAQQQDPVSGIISTSAW